MKPRTDLLIDLLARHEEIPSPHLAKVLRQFSIDAPEELVDDEMRDYFINMVRSNSHLMNAVEMATLNSLPEIISIHLDCDLTSEEVLGFPLHQIAWQVAGAGGPQSEQPISSLRVFGVVEKKRIAALLIDEGAEGEIAIVDPLWIKISRLQSQSHFSDGASFKEIDYSELIDRFCKPDLFFTTIKMESERGQFQTCSITRAMQICKHIADDPSIGKVEIHLTSETECMIIYQNEDY